jgi:shikimate kinase
MDFMISTGIVVYLKMTPGQLKSRLKESTGGRPLINNLDKTELLKYITDKLSEREAYYLKASIIIDSINLDIKALSNMIKARLVG